MLTPPSREHADEPRTAAVVLNWNAADDTLACLTSLKSSSHRITAIVVDNASSDNSLALITNSGLADIIIRNTSNLGFAAGNNVGLARGLAEGFDFLMVLNNDTVVAPDAVSLMLSVLSRSPRRCAVSPRITYFGSADPWFMGGVLDGPFPRHLREDELPADLPEVSTTAFLTGCSLLASRETWTMVGSFDEGFFLIFEDTDWSMRAASSGIELLVVNTAVVEHRVSRTFRQSAAFTLLGRYYFIRNGLHFNWRWRRRHTAAFAYAAILRPVARSVVKPETRSDAAFRVLGLLAWISNRRGESGRSTARFATSLNGRGIAR